MKEHRVRVAPIPSWIDAQRLLGEGPWQITSDGASIEASAELAASAAADLEARLRGVALAGRRLACEVHPRLARSLVRQARSNEARRQRERSEGFSRPGVVLDDAMRLGLTPERLALQLGERARRSLQQRASEDMTVVDACCGAGGNAIGFARSGLRVVAIELDAERLAAARHNAKIYGVADRISFVHGDACKRAVSQHASLWFLDVPWAERDERGQLPLLDELLKRLGPTRPVWAKVPADYDPALVPDAQPSAWFGVGAGDERRVKFVLLERG